MHTYAYQCLKNIGLVTSRGGLFATGLVTDWGGLATNPPCDKPIEDYSTLHRGPRQGFVTESPRERYVTERGGGGRDKPLFRVTAKYLYNTHIHVKIQLRSYNMRSTLKHSQERSSKHVAGGKAVLLAPGLRWVRWVLDRFGTDLLQGLGVAPSAQRCVYMKSNSNSCMKRERDIPIYIYIFYIECVDTKIHKYTYSYTHMYIYISEYVLCYYAHAHMYIYIYVHIRVHE